MSVEVVFIPRIPSAYTEFEDDHLIITRNRCIRFNQYLTVQLNSGHLNRSALRDLLQRRKTELSIADFLCRDWFVHSDKVVFNFRGRHILLKNKNGLYGNRTDELFDQHT